MSNFAHKLLKVVEDKAQRAATHPRFWAYEDGELKPDLYQLDLALETLESLELAIQRAKLELESRRPAAREAARLEYQSGVNRA